MPTKTTNYEFTKPALGDAADITAQNSNWDKVDSELHEHATELSEQKTALEDCASKLNTHTHNLDTITESSSRKVIHLINATSTDGITFTARVDDITELYNGLCIMFIPNRSASNAPTLNINGLGALTINRKSYASNSYYGIGSAIKANKSYMLIYDGSAWVLYDYTKPSAQDLDGVVPYSAGGTNADSLDQAKRNLGIKTIEDKLSDPQTNFGITESHIITSQSNPFDYDYFIAVSETGMPRRIIFTNIEKDTDTLEVAATNTVFLTTKGSQTIIFRTYELWWYWGDGYQLECKIHDTDIGTGKTTSNLATFGTIYGCKINRTPS